MSYVERSLSYDENILIKAQLHFMNYFNRVCFMLIIYAALWSCLHVILQDKEDLIGTDYAYKGMHYFMLLWAIYEILKFKCIEMVCTNKRCIAKKGILVRNTNELKNTKMEAIEIKQSLAGRIFGYGDIWFYGTGTSSVKFGMIRQPVMMKAMIESAIDGGLEQI